MRSQPHYLPLRLGTFWNPKSSLIPSQPPGATTDGANSSLYSFCASVKFFGKLPLGPYNLLRYIIIYIYNIEQISLLVTYRQKDNENTILWERNSYMLHLCHVWVPHRNNDHWQTSKMWMNGQISSNKNVPNPKLKLKSNIMSHLGCKHCTFFCDLSKC